MERQRRTEMFQGSKAEASADYLRISNFTKVEDTLKMRRRRKRKLIAIVRAMQRPF